MNNLWASINGLMLLFYMRSGGEWEISLSSGRKFSLVFVENLQAIKVSFYLRVGKLTEEEQWGIVAHI